MGFMLDDSVPVGSTAKFVVYGTALGLAVDLAVYPAELLKTRLQVTRQGTGTFFKDTISLARLIWRQEGLRGLFRGSASYIAGGLPSQVAYFVAYKESKEWAQTYFGDSVPPVVLYACCGVFADLVATPFWIPVDIVSQRLQLQGAGSVVQYKNARAAARMIYSSDGLKGFFRGTGAAIATYAPASAIWWASYEHCKKVMVDKGFDVSPSTESSRQADGSAFVHATAGFISGSISSIVTNPLDIVKTRIQTQDVDRSVQHKSKGVLDELTRMLKVEGPKSVFRGMFARTMFYGACSSATFICYELALRWST